MTVDIPVPKHTTSHMFRCTFCEQTFNRREHLIRHLRSHTKEKPYHCSICQKSFSRPDVLNRHVATHEGQGQAQPGTAPRACKQCAADRVRCSREQPCRRCSTRNSSCQYPTKRKSRLKTKTLNDGQSQETIDGSSAVQSAGAGPTEASSRISTNVGLGTQIQHATSTSNTPGSGIPDVNDSRDLSEGADGSSAPLKNVPLEYHASNTHQEKSFHKLHNPSGSWDRIPYRPLSSHLYAESSGGAESSVFTTSNTPRSQVSSNSQFESDSAVYSSAGMASTQSSPYEKATYPTSRADDSYIAIHSSYGSRSSAHDDLCPFSAYEALISNVFTTNQVFSVRMSIADFPSYAQMRLFVYHYFDNFHPVFSFLRKSSFAHDASQSWVLLLAVAAVGAKYSTSQHDRSRADPLLRCLSVILHQKHYGNEPNDNPAYNAQSCGDANAVPRAPPDLRLVQAAVLNLMCLMNSGKSAYVHRALMERHYLTDACATLQLLSGNNRIFDIRSSTLQWLEQESRIRTGLIIWFVDTLSRYVFDRDIFIKPSLGLQDIHVMLPSHDEVWEHPETAIKGTRSHSTVTFLGVIEMIYTDKQLPPDVGDYAFNILSHAIYHNTVIVLLYGQLAPSLSMPIAVEGDYNQLNPEFDDTASTPPIASKWRNDALSCLDLFLHRAVQKVAENNGVEHSTIMFLHLARQIVLAPTTNFQAFATGMLTAQQPDSGHHDARTFRNTREAVLKWITKDQFKARLTLVTAGKIFWHVRNYSRNSFLEPHAIFLSTLVLWSFCICIQLPEVVAALDESLVDRPTVSFIHLDGPLEDELVQTFAERGHGMNVFVSDVGNLREPGAASKVLLQGIALLGKDCDSPVAIQGSPDIEHAYNQVWGIEESYILFLSSLSQASQDPRIVNIA